MKSDVGIVVFPGSNSDQDAFHVLHNVLGLKTSLHWHKDPIRPQDYKAILLPGGFSYGDYLRAGALAKLSPAVVTLKEFIAEGKPVIGICNGFQILVEAGYLPGVLMKNQSLHFQCEDVYLRTEKNDGPFVNHLKKGQVLRMPIAHSEGRYFVDDHLYKELERNRQIAFRYCSPSGEVSEEWNANGSIGSIAGVTNQKGNVLGIMPHPERCAEKEVGNEQGLVVFQSLEAYL